MKIEVNMQTLGTDIEAMKELVSRAEKEIRELFDSTEELNTMWEGTTKLEFMNQIGKDQSLFTEVIQSAHQLVEGYETARNEYQSCEANINSKLDALNF